MIRAVNSPLPEASERKALHQRVKRMYSYLNAGQWERCFSLLDPELRERSKVELGTYAEGMEAFRSRYGAVSPWYVRVNLHLDGTPNKRDSRPFAYVYIVWQDQAHKFHMFRERWIKHDGHWFTRVAGLVPNQS